jgi:enamine deaminase RidA (YjgF/YER057c/UK114 family)
MSKIEEKLKELGYELPEIPEPMGFYKPVNMINNLLYTSGQDSRNHKGKVGVDLSIEEAQEAARQSVLRCLASIKGDIGDLDKIDKIFKVLGFVNCEPDFGRQPEVINGGSELLIQVFGENGRHARSAIGSISLPGNAAVEIEMLVAIKE